MDSKGKQSWEEFLNPELTRPRLIAASIYIAGFESLKDSIVDRIRTFFWTGFDRETGDKIDPKYTSDVLARNKSPVYASLDWLKEQSAIDDADLVTFERVKRCRNTLAHKLLSVLSSRGLHAKLCSAVRRILVRVILGWLAERAAARGIEGSRSGAVVLAQRFGGALNLNLHFHVLVIDGTYSASTTNPLAVGVKIVVA